VSIIGVFLCLLIIYYVFDLLINFVFIFGSLQKQEMQKKSNADRIGFMDPTKVNKFEVKHQPDITIAIIYRTLSKFHDKDLILLPYNYKYVRLPSNCPY
jgi:hypothetical protein